jgi:N-acetyl-anhydromuramyl-L-alanine amidase AmpD
MVELANQMIHIDPGEAFDWKAMKAAIRLLAQQHSVERQRDRVVYLVRRMGISINSVLIEVPFDYKMNLKGTAVRILSDRKRAILPG